MNLSERRHVVFLDFDGTLADVDGNISITTQKAIREARRQGHLLFLNTGRSPREIPNRVLDLNFDGYVTAGGAFAEVGDKLVFGQTLNTQQVNRVLDVLDCHCLEYSLQYFDGIYISKGLLDIIRSVFDPTCYSVDPKFVTFERDNRGVAKIVFSGHHENAFNDVLDDLGDHFSVITGTMPHMGTRSGEISDPKLNKAAAFPAILEEVGLPLESTIAIGDAMNDLAMLSAANLGIAMGHAPEAVKAVADEVTSSSIATGVHDAFVRHGLIAPVTDL